MYFNISIIVIIRTFYNCIINRFMYGCVVEDLGDMYATVVNYLFPINDHA